MWESSCECEELLHRDNKGIVQDWRQLTSGKVSFIDEDRPNPAQILKQLRNLRYFQKGGMGERQGKIMDKRSPW